MIFPGLFRVWKKQQLLLSTTCGGWGDFTPKMSARGYFAVWWKSMCLLSLRILLLVPTGLPVHSQGDSQSDNKVMDNITVRQGETVFLRWVSCFFFLPVLKHRYAVFYFIFLHCYPIVFHFESMVLCGTCEAARGIVRIVQVFTTDAIRRRRTGVLSRMCLKGGISED